MRIRTIIIICCIILAVLYAFFGPNKNDMSYRNWENVSVTLTIIYAAVFYFCFLIEIKYEKLNRFTRLFVVSFLGLVLLITLPFSTAFFSELFNNTFLNEIASNLNKGRLCNMWLLTITAVLFLLIDIVMMYSGYDDKDKFHINFKYSEFPVFVSFGVLLLYSYYLGDKINMLDSFFAGAVAFQMISSNIIWLLND